MSKLKEIFTRIGTLFLYTVVLFIGGASAFLPLIVSLVTGNFWYMFLYLCIWPMWAIEFVIYKFIVDLISNS